MNPPAKSLPRATVVIPAHNEARVLGRALTALLADAEPGEFVIVVVANGCTDDTARIAQGFAASGVVCVETATASKAAALNLGDANSREVYPRAYLDADVVLSTKHLRQALDALSDAKTLAVAPFVQYDLSGSTRWAARYTTFLESLPVFGESYLGSGCYILSRTGRARFDEFPDVVGDDRFVDGMFTRSEKCTVTHAPVTAFGPRTLRGIVRRGTRVKVGSLLVDASAGRRDGDSAAVGTRRYVVQCLRRRDQVGGVLVFVMTHAIIAVRARFRLRGRQPTRWSRDDSRG